MKKICNRVDQTGSATECKAGSGRPKSARLDTNIARVEELICSQGGQSGQDLSTSEIADKLDTRDRSVRRITNKDLYCLNNATLLMFVRTFLNARTSLGGIPAKPIIFRQLSTIKMLLIPARRHMMNK